jgi:hypothetical protein
MTNKKKSDALAKNLILFRTSYKEFNSKIHLHVKVTFEKNDL